MDVCMGMILSSVPLLTHQSFRVSTNHFPTFRQQCNLLPRYTVSIIQPVPSILFFVECLFQFGLVLNVQKDSNDETADCFKHFVAMCTVPIGIETVNIFLSSCCVEAFNSAVRSHSLKLRQDYFFETSRIVLMALESLQICIKLVSCVQTCRHRLTHWVRVKLASIYSNKRFANTCLFADGSLSSTTPSPVNTIDVSSTMFTQTFESRSLSLYMIG